LSLVSCFLLSIFLSHSMRWDIPTSDWSTWDMMVIEHYPSRE
jgi:hypothetical protein